MQSKDLILDHELSDVLSSALIDPLLPIYVKKSRDVANLVCRNEDSKLAFYKKKTCENVKRQYRTSNL